MNFAIYICQHVNYVAVNRIAKQAWVDRNILHENMLQSIGLFLTIRQTTTIQLTNSLHDMSMYTWIQNIHGNYVVTGFYV